MTDKDQVSSVLRQYGSTPREQLPAWLLRPDSGEQFDLAMALAMFQTGHPGRPLFGYDGKLLGWSHLTQPPPWSPGPQGGDWMASFLEQTGDIPHTRG